ncbi:ADP-heptose--LPS heptosyltransferase [Pseudomonas sp. FW507-12TSA]|uniref:Glycosyltransferase family 9 protein n=1 Tax=Pseudomonas piscis TaxID=2614538 RepID=A0ABY9NQK6_9PSED|nr:MULTISPECIES: glycosyltransferase family 9 protein [Pseudomonas]POA55445.1 ADP-heptose--LPS heptosyltransferase [Pseudomonas sp. FW507-12TSA]WMN20570.1 glycosyltransferase family 9 protein [Pseudomonas piscis]
MTRWNSCLKSCARRLARLLADRSLKATAANVNPHIVVLRWDAKLGDAIVSSFFYREARKLNVRVTVITVAELAELHALDFAADEVMITHAAPGPLELWRLARKLNRVDAVVHLVGTIQPAEIVFLRLLNPALIYSLDDSLRCVNRKFGAASWGLDTAARYRQVLVDLGAAQVRGEYIVPLPAQLPAPEVAPHILFNPYASRAEKSLAAERSTTLLQAVAETFASRTIGILSSPATLADAQQLEAKVARANVKVVDGLASPRDVAGYLSHAQVIVSVDTAIVHMAVGLGTALVAIYPALEEAFNPWLPPPSARTRVIYSQQSTGRTGRNMNAFPNHMVINALEYLLSASDVLQLEAKIVAGLGVARGTLARQLPLISEHFPEVAACHPGTINVTLDRPLLLTKPDHRTAPLTWTPSGRTTEVFDLLRVELELGSSPARIPAWLYVAHGSPHRDTPTVHELIAPTLDLTDIRRCRLHIRADAVTLPTTDQPISAISSSTCASQ